MESKITATELARNLSDVLNRVRYRGERFLVERKGESVATLTPATAMPRVTWHDVVTRLGDLTPPGEGFADDLEAIQACQPPAEFREWPD
jgi:prevent-host-death family protein